MQGVININGALCHATQASIPVHHRSLRYGDGLFETMRWVNHDICHLEYHIERLQKGMKTLHLDGRLRYDAFFIREKTKDLITQNNIKGNARVRLLIYRDGAGLYTPETNESGYIIEVEAISEETYVLNSTGLIIDVYREHKKQADDFSSLKHNNALLYVLAGVKKKKLGIDDMLLLNQDGFLCEAISANIFVWYKEQLYTPALSEGCVDGVMRRVIMKLTSTMDIPVIEAQINPEILHGADEMFLTNAITGIKWVMGYGKKRYFNHLSKKMLSKLNEQVFFLKEN